MKRFEKSDQKAFFRLLQYLKKFRGQLVLAIGAGIALAGFDVGISRVVKLSVDALNSKNLEEIWRVFYFICALFLGNLILSFIRNYYFRAVGERCVATMREEVAQRMLAMPVTFFEGHPVGKLVSRVIYDSGAIPAAMEGLGYYVTSPLKIVALVGFAFYIHWKLTLLVFITAPLIILVFRFLGGSVQRNAKRANLAMGEMSTWLQETAQGIRTIKVFGSEPVLFSTFLEKNRISLKAILKMIFVQELASPFNGLVMAVFTASIFLFGGYHVAKGELGAGDLMQLVTCLGLLQEPIRRLNGVHMKLMQGLAGAQSLFELMDAPIEAVDINLAPIAPPSYIDKDVNIEFEKVSFRYESHERAPQVLHEVNFSLRQGEWLGLRGRSGSGKTTIAHLIPALYQKFSGKILLNQKDIRAYSLSDLRASISLVGQDVFLFHDTIYKNILMGRPSASQDEVIQAAHDAFAMEFIAKFPLGMDTVIGDRGCKLSGGQKQRLSIARAFLKRAPFIILDEATSALDPESEDAVQQALRKLMNGKTVLIIAHKESSLSQAHRVIDIQEGRIL